jgi:hypothetical protein
LKKINLFYLLLVLVLSACTPRVLTGRVNIKVPMKPGRCFATSRLKTNKISGFILQTFDNQYITVRDSLKIDSLEIGEEEIFRLKTKDDRYKYVIKIKVAKECINDGKSCADYFAICIIETPGEYLGITNGILDSLKRIIKHFFILIKAF